MQTSCAASGFKGLALTKPVAVPCVARPAGRRAIVCKAQQQQVTVAKVAAAAAALPSLLAASPALALVDERLGGEGTGKPFGVGGLEGWAIFIVFGLVWAAYYQATKELGGDAGDDSGLSL
ncbi:hypothetical protein WJX84_010493 [Apatococcus fuscideae]|uniref:PSII 6.1 kDa protein n=1 Tax=Apatococcus fuscideae TaxID=2026836 RepID=A0AAW1SZQ4_9CHLO